MLLNSPLASNEHLLVAGPWAEHFPCIISFTFTTTLWGWLSNGAPNIPRVSDSLTLISSLGLQVHAFNWYTILSTEYWILQSFGRTIFRAERRAITYGKCEGVTAGGWFHWPGILVYFFVLFQMEKSKTGIKFILECICMTLQNVYYNLLLNP